MERAKNHLVVSPHDAEGTLGPPLFYHLPARRQGRLRRPCRRPGALPRLAGPELPLLAGVVPQGFQEGLPPQGRPDFPPDRPAPAPAPRPPEGHRRILLRPT